MRGSMEVVFCWGNMPVLDGRCSEAYVGNRIHLPTEPLQAKLAAVCPGKSQQGKPA